MGEGDAAGAFDDVEAHCLANCVLGRCGDHSPHGHGHESDEDGGADEVVDAMDDEDSHDGRPHDGGDDNHEAVEAAVDDYDAEAHPGRAKVRGGEGGGDGHGAWGCVHSYCCRYYCHQVLFLLLDLDLLLDLLCCCFGSLLPKASCCT